MPQDFRSGRETAQTIGFHELRQACEISALRQDLERLVDEAGALRSLIEERVERVSDRFAALTPADLADGARMLPLLEYAVSTLVGIRDAARRTSQVTGTLPDDQRPAPPRLRGLDVHPAASLSSPPAPPAAIAQKAATRAAAPPPPAPAPDPAPAPAAAAPALPPPPLATPPDSLLAAATEPDRTLFPAPPPHRAPPVSVASPLWVLPADPGQRRTGSPGQAAEGSRTVDWFDRPKR